MPTSKALLIVWAEIILPHKKAAPKTSGETLSAKIGKLPFVNTSEFPLIHYNHSARTKDMRKQNTQAGRRAEKEGKTNWLI